MSVKRKVQTMPYHCNVCNKEHATQELCPAVRTGEQITSLQEFIKEKDIKTQPHYTQFKIQPATFIAANSLGYFEGNIIKYVCRYKAKNGIEDLKKAAHYLEMLIEMVETGEVKL